MAWLVRDEEVLATVTVLSGWRSAIAGAWMPEASDSPVIVKPAFWAQSIASPFDADVAFLNAEGVVVRTLRLPRNRVALPAFSARAVLRAKKGAFGTWDVKIGDEMELRPCG